MRAAITQHGLVRGRLTALVVLAGLSAPGHALKTAQVVGAGGGWLSARPPRGCGLRAPCLCARGGGGVGGARTAMRSGSETPVTGPSLRELFDEGSAVTSEELLGRQWDGCVPFPGAADEGASYRPAQIVMAILARASGWAGLAHAS